VEIEVEDPPGNVAPDVRAAAAPRTGTAPLEVRFTADARDPDGDQMLVVWDFGDGREAGGPNHTVIYEDPGTYTATVTATDIPGRLTDTDTVTIVVTDSSGNVPPQPSAPPTGPGAQGDVGGESQSRPSIRAPKARTVRSVIRRGLRLRVTCEESCRARSVLRISGKRVGASKAVRIGAGGSRTLVARLSRNVRRNLVAAMRQAGLKRVRLTAVTTITTDGVTRAFPVRVTLKR
jgi:hypothetical protein